MENSARRWTIAAYAVALSEVAAQRAMMATFPQTGSVRQSNVETLIKLLEDASRARVACYALADGDE